MKNCVLCVVVFVVAELAASRGGYESVQRLVFDVATNPELLKRVADPKFWKDWKDAIVGKGSAAPDEPDEGSRETPGKETALLSHMIYDFTDMKDSGRITQNALAILDQIAFEDYEESNVQDYSAGIPLASFNATVENFAKLLRMPAELKNIILDAACFQDEKQVAIHRMGFKTDDGGFHFGRVAVKKRKDGLVDIGYSLHGVKFVVAPSEFQLNHSNSGVQELIRFKGGFEKGYFTFKGRNTLGEFFHLKAIEEFQRNYGVFQHQNLAKKESPKESEESKPAKDEL